MLEYNSRKQGDALTLFKSCIHSVIQIFACDPQKVDDRNNEQIIKTTMRRVNKKIVVAGILDTECTGGKIKNEKLL